MNERKPTSAPQSAPTDVFKADAQAKVQELKPTDTGLYTVDGVAHRALSERTLKKRLAKLASSRSVLLLALLVSLSAILTAFRGYLVPITVFLTAERVLFAVGLWMVYITAGKKGGKLLAALPLYSGVAAIIGLLFLAAFISCAMFGKLLLFQTEGSVQLVRVIYSAKLWAIVPALLCIMAAYCFYLFKRHERQLLCNVRDGLKYGFPFEQGYSAYARSCVAVAVLFAAFQITRAFFGGFSQLGFIPDHAVKMLDSLLLPQLNYGVSLVGVLVQAASLVLAATLAYRYGNTVKKYKAQKAALDGAKQAAKESANAVIEMENEKAAARAKNDSGNAKA